MAMRIKKGDTVKVIAGSAKGKVGTVARTDQTKHLVFLEKIGLVKRHVKPTQLNPRGGTKEIHVGFAVGKVAIVTDEAKGTTSRIGYKTGKDGKVRVAKKTGKEIK